MRYIYVLEYRSHSLEKEDGSSVFYRKKDAEAFQRVQKALGYQCYLHRKPIAKIG